MVTQPCGYKDLRPDSLAVKTHTQPLLSTDSKDSDRILDRRDPEYK